MSDESWKSGELFGRVLGARPMRGDVKRNCTWDGARRVQRELIVVRFSEKAVLVKECEPDEPVWLPLSQVKIDVGLNGCSLIDMPDWLAVEKGLE